MKNMNEQQEGFTKAGNRGGALMKLLLFLVIFGGVLTAAWVYFLPAILSSTLQKRTGFGVKVTELRFNPFNAKVDLNGFIITNPEGFPRRDFIEVRSFNANARMKTLFSDRPEFDYAWIEVACVTFVRDADGVFNAQLFRDRLNPQPPVPMNEDSADGKNAKSAQTTLDAKATTGGPVNRTKIEKKPLAKDAKSTPGKDVAGVKEDAAPEKPALPPMKFLIRHLNVSLDKVIVADYLPATPTVREFNRKVVYSFTDVSDPKQLFAPFALKSLESVGAAIKGLIPGEIGKAFGAVTNSAEETPAKKMESPAEDPVKTVVEKLEESQKP